MTRHPNADEATIREELEGNLCRCTGYHNIVKAVQQGAAAMGNRETTMGANDSTGIASEVNRPIGAPQGRRPLPDGRGPVHRRRHDAAARRTRYFLRSPHAHATIRGSTRRRRRPRRAWSAIYTGADLDGVNGLPCGWLITGTDGKPMNEPPHPVLAQGQGALRRRSGRARRRRNARRRRRTRPS